MRQVSDELRQEGEACVPQLVEEFPVALTTLSKLTEQVLHLGSVFKVIKVIVGFTFVQHPPRVFAVRSLEPEASLRAVPKQNPRGQAQRASKEAGFVGIDRKHFDVRGTQLDVNPRGVLSGVW